MKSLLFDKKGQSLVEFALVLPVLLLILLGIMEGGRIFAAYVELQSVTRDATRYAAIHKEATESYIIDNKLKKDVTPPLLEPTKFTEATVDLIRYESPDKKDSWVQVTVNYSMDLMTPFFGAVVGDPFNFTSRMIMRVE